MGFTLLLLYFIVLTLLKVQGWVAWTDYCDKSGGSAWGSAIGWNEGNVLEILERGEDVFGGEALFGGYSAVIPLSFPHTNAHTKPLEHIFP